VDLDYASATELDRLPGIGPSLAARIVADRDSAGPFGSLEGLQRVRGIGPALATKLSPFVVFSGRAPPRGR
jgi:competence protein ComEA